LFRRDRVFSVVSGSCPAGVGPGRGVRGGRGGAGGAHSGQGYTLGGDLGALASEGLEGLPSEHEVEQQELALLMGRAFVDVGKRCESVSTLILQQVGPSPAKSACT